MKRKRVLNVLIIIAYLLVITVAIYQIASIFIFPDSTIVNRKMPIWYLPIIVQIAGIVLASILQIIQFRNARKIYSQRFFAFTEEFINYIEKKNTILNNLSPETYPREILCECLKFIEDYLKKYIGKNCFFETSIFTDPNEPYIYAYHDTHGNTQPSSYNKRQSNTRYYIDNNYEVIKLLRQPTNQLIIISSTIDENYHFANIVQKKYIASQLMFCFHMTNPYVLVITCNREKAFMKNDFELEAFIGNIGKMLNSELLIKENICCVNNYNCCNWPE